MKKLNHTVFITTCLCLLPLFAALLLWDRMPDQVPMHWNAAGEIDGYGSKPLDLLGLPCMMAGLNLFLHFMLDKDPKTDNMSRALKGISYWLLPAL
ncbi:MAG: DUF1648 domain-containing protein, partial [Clostridia bacterium]|nr:DUF1648 domain-containing protein [Clostridia bacterium]